MAYSDMHCRHSIGIIRTSKDDEINRQCYGFIHRLEMAKRLKMEN